MSQEPRLNPTKQHIEAMLGQLCPNAQSLDQDVLMFKSGQATVGSKRPWQVASGILLVLLCAALVIRPDHSVPSAASVVPEQSLGKMILSWIGNNGIKI